MANQEVATPGARPPRALAVAGRRIDAPGADIARFPAARIPVVREAIRAFLERACITCVVASAASGADLIALTEAGELGIRRRVVLPFSTDRFRETSVVDRPGGFGPVFDKVVEGVRARGDLIVLDGSPGDDAAYAAANDAILQEALRQGRLAGGESLALVVWDELPREGGDTTRSLRDRARQLGFMTHSLRTVPAPSGTSR